MYWVNRKAAESVLRNPFDSSELMSKSKVNIIFTDINKMYKDDFDNRWARGTIPLNYFVKKYVASTGLDPKQLTTEFVKYFEKTKIEDLTELE